VRQKTCYTTNPKERKGKLQDEIPRSGVVTGVHKSKIQPKTVKIQGNGHMTGKKTLWRGESYGLLFLRGTFRAGLRRHFIRDWVLDAYTFKRR